MRPRLAVYSHLIPPPTTADERRVATRPVSDETPVTAFELMPLIIGRHLEVGLAPRRLNADGRNDVTSTSASCSSVCSAGRP